MSNRTGGLWLKKISAISKIQSRNTALVCLSLLEEMYFYLKETREEIIFKEIKILSFHKIVDLQVLEAHKKIKGKISCVFVV